MMWIVYEMKRRNIESYLHSVVKNFQTGTLYVWFFSVNCLIIDISIRHQRKNEKSSIKIHIKHVWFSYQHRRKIVYNYFHLKTCTKFSHSVFRIFAMCCAVCFNSFSCLLSFILALLFFSILDSFTVCTVYIYSIKAFIFYTVFSASTTTAHIYKKILKYNRMKKKETRWIEMMKSTFHVSWYSDSTCHGLVSLFSIRRVGVYEKNFPIFQFFLLHSWHHTQKSHVKMCIWKYFHVISFGVDK